MDWKYKKFTLLFVSFAIAYFLISNQALEQLLVRLSELDYFGAFFVGMGFAYGFTAAPATAILILMGKTTNIFLLAVVAGCGALAADLLIIRFIRHSFHEEIEHLKAERIVKYITRHIPPKVGYYLLPVMGWLIIASPLPDEIGVILLGADEKLKESQFILASWLLNTIGLFVILMLTK